MTTELKNKILYSNLITELILTNNVLAIYLGGSRFYNLDSSESDYDIIVISKGNSLLNYNKTKLILNDKDIKIHIAIQPINSLLDLIKSPNNKGAFKINKGLIELLMGLDNKLIYSTQKFTSLHNILIKYNKELTYLALSNCIQNLKGRITLPVKGYNKIYYHYLVMYFLFKNFKELNTLVLTTKQKEIITKFKYTKIIPMELYSALDLTINTLYCYDYSKIYKEVKVYE